MDEYYFKSLSRCKPLPPSVAVELHKRMHEGDQQARDLLIESMLRFIYRAVKPHASKRCPAQDIASDLIPDAIRAIERWNPEQGKLSTIVGVYIKNALKRYTAIHAHNGIYVPYYTRMAILNGEDENCSPKRKQELARAKAAMAVASFSANDECDIEDIDREATYSYCLADLDQLLERVATPVERKALALKYIESTRTTLYGDVGKQIGMTAEKCKLMLDRLIGRLKQETKCKYCGGRFVSLDSQHCCSNRSRLTDCN